MGLPLSSGLSHAANAGRTESLLWLASSSDCLVRACCILSISFVYFHTTSISFVYFHINRSVRIKTTMLSPAKTTRKMFNISVRIFRSSDDQSQRHGISSELDCFPSPRRFVNRHHDPQVPQSFFAWCQWLVVIHYAFRHVIHLQGEMIALAQIALFN